MKKLLIFLLASAGCVFAGACNPLDQSACPAASAPANGVIAGTAWDPATNTPTGATISVLRNQTYGLVAASSCSGSNPCCNGMDIYYTTGADMTYPMLFMPHAGGLNTSSRNTPLGGTGPTNVILLLQQLWNRKTGMKGGVAIVMDYTLTAGCSSGTPQPFPYQIREIHEALYYIVNDAGATIPGNRRNMIAFEYSAGAYLAAMAVATKGSAFYSNLGPNTPTNAYTFTAGVFISPFWGWTTAASPYSTYDHNNSLGTTTINADLNCTTTGNCATADAATQASLLFWINQANYANLNIPMFLAYGYFDNLVMNFTGSGYGLNGNQAQPMNGQVGQTLLAGLNPPINVVNRGYPYNHGAGLINNNGGPHSAVFKDALYFLNNRQLPTAVMQ